MKVSQLESKLTEKFVAVSDSPNIESEILICYVLDWSKSIYLLNQNKEVTEDLVEKIFELADQRLKNIPLEYITGKKFFYKNEFNVNNSTLIPRPESELLVSMVVEKILQFQASTINVIEIGIGSGCLTISIIDELRNRSVEKQINFFATDISADAIQVAISNVEKILRPISRKNNKFEITKNISLTIEKANIIEGESNESSLKKNIYNFVISNPPYIPTRELEVLQKEVKNEPRIALDGGQDGLDTIRKIMRQLEPLTIKDSIFLFEIHSDTDYLVHYLNSLGDRVEWEIFKDLNKLPRILLIKDCRI